MPKILLTAALVVFALTTAHGAEPVEVKDPVTGLTHREKIASERLEDAKRVAAEPTSRPWLGTKGREAYGLSSKPSNLTK